MLKILTVAAFATFEIYAAIPMGFAFGLNAWTVFFAALVGGIAGVFIAAFLGDKIREFINKYRKPKPPKPHTGFIKKVWDKYGVIGLGTIGTFTVGAPISMAVGVGVNVRLAKLIPWCCLGVFLRCAVFTTVGHYGMKLL